MRLQLLVPIAFLAACAAAATVLADGLPAPDSVEATFDAARLRDDLRGELTDAAKEVRVEFHATVGSTLSATLSGTEFGASAPAGGLELVLCTGDGTDLGVAGGPRDKSRAGSGVVKWRKVALPQSGRYVLVVRAATPGGWRLALQGALAGPSARIEGPEVPPFESFEHVVDGLAGGTLRFRIDAAPAKSKFRGELTQVLQPDDQPLLGAELGSAGRLVLAQDGPHRLVFRNSSASAGTYRLKTKLTPPRAYPREGIVRPAGTALTPVVKTVDPDAAFHRQEALAVTLTGRDFQPGLDVRLTRRGRPDIVATGVEVRSETEAACVLDLDTTDTDGENSVGAWTLRATNARETGEASQDASKRFTSLASASIRLPDGVQKKSEVWFVDFNAEFQNDLNRMGLGSADPKVRELARDAVEAYTILFLRDLFGANETNGKIGGKGGAVPVSFVVEAPPAVAGLAGVDYNRIEVGGAYENGDDRDPAEPLLWGFAPFDAGNTRREDLSVLVEDGAGTRRVGHGARTRALDPGAGSATNGWINATAPLRNRPLGASDEQYFKPLFDVNTFDPQRYRDLVEQTTRASREIAAVIAHHVGRAMGLPAGGQGPMASPASSGEMWATTRGLAFLGSDLATLRAAAVPHELPGKSGALAVSYFPLVSSRPFVRSLQAFSMDDLTTDENYSKTFDFVGGRPNAVPSDYLVQYVVGSAVPRGLRLTATGLEGKAPLYASQNEIYCGVLILRLAITDNRRGGTRFLRFRLRVLPAPNSKFPPALHPSADQCRAQVAGSP